MNLTEQHRSGKLERNRDYFVKVNDKVVSIYLDWDNDFIYYGHIIKPEVLAAVPTYEEWQNLRAKLDFKETAYDFDTDRLEKENKKLKEDIKNLNEKIKRWKKLFNKIDSVYSLGLYLNVKNEFMLLTSNARELNELFNKWEEEELNINGGI